MPTHGAPHNTHKVSKPIGKKGSSKTKKKAK